MNKDKIGLIKYLIILVFEITLPLFWWMSFISIFIESQSTFLNIIAIIGLLLLFILPIAYLLLPVITTILAIRNHWSCYLDKFFNHLKIPTFLFGIAFILIILEENFNILINLKYSQLWVYLYYAILPLYCLIYLVTLFYNIKKKFKKDNTD